MSKRDEELALERARAAQHLLSNELLKQAFEDLDAYYKSAVFSSKPTQHELREECYRMVAVLAQVKMALTRHIETGKIVADTRGKRERDREAQR